MQRYRFFGKNTVIVPVRAADRAARHRHRHRAPEHVQPHHRLGPIDFRIGFGFHSLVIAHATFCVVIVYNNVIARLRRSSPNLHEASADLGADGCQTFRYVTFPLVRSALSPAACWPSR